jgi:hypothetical protein
MMPTRTTDPATPCAPSLAPNSSAAKATVWLKRRVAEPGRQLRRGEQPEHVADRRVEALSAAPTTAATPWGGDSARRRRLRRVGSAKTQPNHGMASR